MHFKKKKKKEEMQYLNEEARLVMRAPKELVAGPHTKHQVSQKNQNILVGTPGHKFVTYKLQYMH